MNDEVKVAFEKRLDEMGQVAASKAAGGLNDLESSGLNRGETN